MLNNKLKIYRNEVQCQIDSCAEDVKNCSNQLEALTFKINTMNVELSSCNSKISSEVEKAISIWGEELTSTTTEHEQRINGLNS